MDSPDERARARDHWRNQLRLTCLSGIAFVLSVGATQLVLADFGRDPENRPVVVAALAICGLGLTAVLTLLVVHVLRVAAFTFRRGDP